MQTALQVEEAGVKLCLFWLLKCPSTTAHHTDIIQTQEPCFHILLKKLSPKCTTASLHPHIQSNSYSNIHKIPCMDVLTVYSKIKIFHASEELLKQGGEQPEISFKNSLKLARFTRPLLARVNHKRWEPLSHQIKLSCKDLESTPAP